MENKIIQIPDGIPPFWEKSEAPIFISRTDTEYSKLPISILSDRGLENRLLQSLLEHLPENAYIVGGFCINILTGEKTAKDIDIAFTTEQAFKETLNLFHKGIPKPIDPSEENTGWAFQGYKVNSDMESFQRGAKEFRYIAFKHDTLPPVQLLKLCWYDSPEHIIDSFDITISQIAINKEYIWINPITPMDISRKRIVLHRMQFPASTLRRIIKYTQKGYYACPGALGNICKEIIAHEGDLNIDGEQFVYLD